MTLGEQLLAANREYVERGFPGGRPLRPRRALAIVACMDSRMDLFALLGLDVGDAHVLRNAGGVVTDDVIRSLAISQRKLGTRDIVLVHHTDCGMTKLRDDEFAAELEADAGERPPFAIESFRDPDESVRESIARLRASPFLAHDGEIAGFVFDVETGLLRAIS
jgi:carbonic anhydrase